MKKAIITGGTKGIGLATARMLLQEGYFVTATYAHDEASALAASREMSHISDRYEIVCADQSDKASMRAFAERMRAKSAVDCLVCNAGATLRIPLAEITDDEWERVMQINVNSNVYLIRDLMGSLAADARIVIIGSLMAIHPHGTSLAYGVTKAAVHAVALNLVKCFEGTAVTVNVVAPGFVETEWQRSKPQAIRDNICGKTAARRFATPDEVADAVRFCIGNAFVNGSVIEVSGGYDYK